MRKINSNKIFKYKSICHSLGAQMFSTKHLKVGEVYDVYYCSYPFSDEYEIFKDGEYYTSFMLSITNGESESHCFENDRIFTKHFYNQSQMTILNREGKLKELGI